jgi:hypothetical protein
LWQQAARPAEWWGGSDHELMFATLAETRYRWDFA